MRAAARRWRMVVWYFFRRRIGIGMALFLPLFDGGRPHRIAGPTAIRGVVGK
jgi:hypothetical protein